MANEVLLSFKAKLTAKRRVGVRESISAATRDGVSFSRVNSSSKYLFFAYSQSGGCGPCLRDAIPQEQ